MLFQNILRNQGTRSWTHAILASVSRTQGLTAVRLLAITWQQMISAASLGTLALR